MARTPKAATAKSVTAKSVAAAPKAALRVAVPAASVAPAALAAAASDLLTDSDAISDRSTVLYDPETGAIEGIHRVITLPGGKPAPGADAALAAEALGIAPGRTANLKALVQQGAPDPDKVLSVDRAGGVAKLVQVALARPVRRPAG